MYTFEKRYNQDGSYIIWEIENRRQVSEEYMYYLEFLANGNLPTEITYVAPPILPEDPSINERKAYENKYLQATKQLMILAGEIVEENDYPKLEDVDFATIGLSASNNAPGPAGFLLATLNYTLTTLKYDYGWQWSQIEYRPEIN